MLISGVRPCGACRALVPSETGCEHWKPGLRGKANDARRARNARYHAQARERACRDVAAFQALMTRRSGLEIVPKL